MGKTGCTKCGSKVYTTNYTKQLNDSFVKKGTTSTPKVSGNTITVNGVKYNRE